MRSRFRRAALGRAAPLVSVVCAVSLAPLTVTAAGPADQPVRLHGSSVAGLQPGDRIGDLDSSVTMDIQLGLQLRDRPALDQLITSVSTPGSAEYGHYLTPAEFASRFGPTLSQVDQAAAFLRSHGLTVTEASVGSALVDARGTVAAVSSAIHTSIGTYRDRSGRTFFANDSDPTLPASLASFVVGVQGLNNRYQRHHTAFLPHACPPSCASTPYTPPQLRQAYQLNAGPLATMTGTGQSLGLLELDDFSQSDISSFSTTYGLPAISPNRLVVDGPVTIGSGQVEVELDVEVMHEFAPEASIQVFEAPNNTDAQLLDAYGCMVSPQVNAGCPNHASGQISRSNSTSWGLCEPDQAAATTTALSNIFSQAATQGQSFFAASGDSGAADCLYSSGSTAPAVDSPASDPHVTGTGGTRLYLNPSTNTYNSETAWPASPPKNPNWGSGGGTSVVYSRPSWQAGAGVNTSPSARRQVPDVALDADPVTGYSIYSCLTAAPCSSANAGLSSIAGTSAAAPAWAAFTAIYNQYAACQGKPNLGFANTALYPLGINPPTFTPFNDITTGDNLAGQTTGYYAGPGYDMVTGLGTLRASDVSQDLAGTQPAAGVTVTSIVASQGLSGDTVHVIGCGFQLSGGQAPSVSFGSTPSRSVSLVSSNDLSAVVPAHAVGQVSVTVTNPPGAGGAGSSLANAFTYVPGGYTLDAYGGLHGYGGAPPVPDAGHAYWPGWNIARGAAVCPDNNHRGYSLDGYGGLHKFGSPVGNLPDFADGSQGFYWGGWDIARGIVLTQCTATAGGYVLDGFGGVHAFGNPAPPSVPDGRPGSYWQGWDIARGIALCPDVANSGYVLDGFGGVHAFGGAPPVADSSHAYWPGWNIARSLAVTSCAGGSATGYVLDGWGGVHGFGTADPQTTAYWQGWDIARGVTVLSGTRSGYVLDGWGGLHVFGSPSPVQVPDGRPGAYWTNWDIAKAVASSS